MVHLSEIGFIRNNIKKIQEGYDNAEKWSELEKTNSILFCKKKFKNRQIQIVHLVRQPFFWLKREKKKK